MYTFENINSILNAMADEGILEPMAEPCDCSDAHPLDWAEVTGLSNELADEIYPESMVDENGQLWYVS